MAPCTASVRRSVRRADCSSPSSRSAPSASKASDCSVNTPAAIDTPSSRSASTRVVSGARGQANTLRGGASCSGGASSTPAGCGARSTRTPRAAMRLISISPRRMRRAFHDSPTPSISSQTPSPSATLTPTSSVTPSSSRATPSAVISSSPGVLIRDRANCTIEFCRPSSENCACACGGAISRHSASARGAARRIRTPARWTGRSGSCRLPRACSPARPRPPGSVPRERNTANPRLRRSENPRRTPAQAPR